MKKFILNTEAAQQIANDIEEHFGVMPNYNYESILAAIDYEWTKSADDDVTCDDIVVDIRMRRLMSEDLYNIIRATFLFEIAETLGVSWN